jgi:hypothetical protein
MQLGNHSALLAKGRLDSRQTWNAGKENTSSLEEKH